MKINRKALRAIALFSATSDIRYYRNGVCVEVVGGDVRLIATDGPSLAVHRSTANEIIPATQIIIPLAAIKTVAAKGSDDIELTRLDGKRWLLDATIFEPVEAHFPDYRRVMPRQVSGEPGDYNADLYAVFAKAADILNGRRNGGRCTYIKQNGQNAAFVGIHGYPDFAGVIMPKSHNVEGKVIEPPPIPAWCAQ